MDSSSIVPLFLYLQVLINQVNDYNPFQLTLHKYTLCDPHLHLCNLRMKLTLSKSIVKSSSKDGYYDRAGALTSKVTALSYSPDNTRLAVATADRAISLYSHQGKLVDKFQTKPNADGPKDYIVRALKFGPNTEQPKLAIAQSDAIVFVYKWKQVNDNNNEIGHCYHHHYHAWDGKKSICNKFPEQSAVTTSLIWSRKQPYQIVYGLLEGKVKIANLRSNKAKTLYKIDTCPVVSLAMNIEGTELLSGHKDGHVYRFVFPTKTQNSTCSKIITCATVPYILSWGKSICVAGLDERVSFYNIEGNEEQTFSYNCHERCSNSNGLLRNENMSSSEFTTSCCSPSGDSIIVGSFDCFYHFCWDAKRSLWQEKATHFVKNMYSVNAIDWKPNGSSFALGTSSGLVDEYNNIFRQYEYKGAFNITYISPSQILIRDIEDSNTSPILMESTRGEIVKLNIYHEPGTSTYRYVVARTLNSLVFCDMESPAQPTSEIDWHCGNNSKEKFIFEASNACMICKDGEVMIVEYGQDVILASIQTNFHSACLLSLRVMESICVSHQQMSSKGVSSTKVVAYLLDQRTICIKDLTKMAILSVEHNVGIDFLELNTTCSHLIFRDKKQDLTLYNIIGKIKTQILTPCGYTQWIPGTDVLVAQSGDKMCVWYNILATNQVSSVVINGEIEGIERVDGRTEVMVDVKGTIVAHPLSDDLICFSSAVQLRDLATCVDILEKTSNTEQNYPMWQELQQISIQVGDLPIAQRCAAALGNISLVRYIKNTLKCTDDLERNPQMNWRVQVQVFQLSRAFNEAEKLYLSYSKVDDAISMYENMMMFQDALRVIRSSKSSNLQEKLDLYLQTLMDNNQEEKAAQLLVEHGDHIRAISIYLEVRLPGRAAQVILEKDIVHPQQLLEGVAKNLSQLGLMKKAGQIYQKIGQFQNALTHFVKGLDFQEALSLARKEIPSKVTEIEELWGDYLVSMNQPRRAIDHFIGSHTLMKAVEASISAKMWDKASEIVKQLRDIPQHRIESLATKFSTAKRFKDAEMLFMQANMKSAIVSMYIQQELWDDAMNRAGDLLSESEIEFLFEKEAQNMIAKKKYKTAEKLLLLSNKPEEAVEMWKNVNNVENAMILVNKHCQELFVETSQFFASARENEDLLDEAEILYINAGDWLGAINMYRKNGQWNDAIRVAKSSEDNDVVNRVAYAYSIFLGESAQEVLSNMELLDNAIEFAIENGSFNNAIALAEGNKSKDFLTGVHLKAAQFLEDCGKLEDAEHQYIQSGNASDAIGMYIRAKSWDDAERIARRFNNTELKSVFIAKANNAAESKNYKDAEELYMKYGLSNLVLEMYKRNEMWEDAMRVSRKYLPQRDNEIKRAVEKSNNQVVTNHLHKGKRLEEAQLFDEAINAYLQPQIGDYSNPNDLEKIWSNAIRLVITKCPRRTQDVCNDITSRLCKMGLVIKAAEIFDQCNETESALELFIESKHWDKAKTYAQGDDRLMSIYFDAFREHLIQQENSNDLLRLGETREAFEIMIRNGEWNRIWTILRDDRELCSDDYADYTVIRMEELLKDSTSKSICEILSTLLTDEAPIPDYHSQLNLYLDLVQQILYFDKHNEGLTDYCKILHDLKVVLTSSFMKFHPGEHSINEVSRSFIHLIMTVHFSYMMETFESNGLLNLACKCSLTLFRFVIVEINGMKRQLIPSDKVFYRAGLLCKMTNDEQLAFALLNAYIDVVEGTEEEEANEDLSELLSNDDFDSTNIPIREMNLPTDQYIPDEESREEIRDWVLGICIDSSVERSIPKLGNVISGKFHEGLYDCPCEKCIVTGFPIPEGQLMKVGSIEANEEDWNAFVHEFGCQPWKDINISSAYLIL